jgi:hypothetical protein
MKDGVGEEGGSEIGSLSPEDELRFRGMTPAAGKWRVGSEDSRLFELSNRCERRAVSQEKENLQMMMTEERIG